MIFAYPLDFLPNSTAPKQPLVFDAAQKYCEEQFGHSLDLSDSGMKTWVVIKKDKDGDGFKIIGISRFRRVLDIPVFHVTPSETEEGKQEAREARDMLTSRMWGYAQDQFGAGGEVMVFIDPASERFWKGYLKLIRAKPAHRYTLQV
jgi:hypothetical protein